MEEISYEVKPHKKTKPNTDDLFENLTNISL